MNTTYRVYLRTPAGDVLDGGSDDFGKVMDYVRHVRKDRHVFIIGPEGNYERLSGQTRFTFTPREG
jgi:hypothetical protein